MPAERSIAEFNAAQRAALLSMDEAKIRAFLQEWNGEEMPKAPVAFWGAVHKAITGIPSLPLAFRRQSKAWLSKRRLASFDDGDL